MRIFSDWGTPPLPPTIGKVALLGATLRAGGYRSAAGYLSLYRSTCTRDGYSFSPDVALAARDAARSCARGLGGPVRATPLPLDRLHLLGGSRAPWIPGGPCSPRNAIVTGSWWLLREVELATVRASLVEVSASPEGLLVVALTLPASKSDQSACGVARGHRCRCRDLPSPHGCPAHAVLDQLLFLKRQFPEQWVGDRVARDMPLFPQLAGSVCTKAAMVGTIAAAAGQLQVPLANPDGTSRVSGHSLRVGGAQGLARLCFPVWSIQLMGRWGTETVKQYIGDAALDIFTGTAQSGPTDPTDLTDFVAAVTRATTDRRPNTGRAREGRASSRPSGLPSSDLIEQVVGERVGDLRTELLAAVSAEVRLECARAAPAQSPPSVTDRTTATVTTADWAQNARTGCWHIVCIGPGSGVPSTHWTTMCGWSFGNSGGYSLEYPPPAADRCGRCIGIAAKGGS